MHPSIAALAAQHPHNPLHGQRRVSFRPIVDQYICAPTREKVYKREQRERLGWCIMHRKKWGTEEGLCREQHFWR
jgi:hypothetical protein